MLVTENTAHEIVKAEFQAWLDQHPLAGRKGFKIYHGEGPTGWYQLYHVEIPEEARGDGHGTEIVRHLIVICDRQNVNLYVEAIPGRYAWYKRLGFRNTKELGEGGIIHLYPSNVSFP